MASIQKFISTYKDKTFDEVPFSEVDIAVAALFSYASFEKTTLYKKYDLSRNFCRASNFYKLDIIEILSKNYINPKEFKKFISPILSFKRYRNIKIGYMRNYFSNSHTMQFFAFTLIAKNYNIIVFRGTDISLVGWEEDFNMMLEDNIPSQEAAKRYVQEISEYDNKPLIITGHSKGGHLAYYAYFNSSEEIKSRVNHVYNLDGPGFKDDKYDYSEFGTKLFKFVPRDDVFGVMFDYSDNIIPIKSRKSGVNAHDILTWQVSKKSNYCEFARADSLTRLSRTFRISLATWYKTLKEDDLRKAADFIVDIATCNNQTDLFSLKLDIIKKRKVYLDCIANYNQATKDRLKQISRDLVKTYFVVLLHLKDYNNKGEKIQQ